MGVILWNKLLRETVKGPSLEILKTWPDIVLGNLLHVTLLQQGAWTRWCPEAPPTSTTLWCCDSFSVVSSLDCPIEC